MGMSMKKNEDLTLSDIENKYLCGKDVHTPVSSTVNPKTTDAPLIKSKFPEREE